MKLKIIFLFMLVIVFLVTMSSAEVPKMINYQGKLTTPQGVLIDTTIPMTFAIYTDSIGTDSLWSETQSSVVVGKGIFSVLLGSMSPIPDSVFTGAVGYLGVKAGDDPEMTPRKAMVSVAYAYRAGTADGGSGVNCGWVDDGTVVRLELDTDSVGIGTKTPGEKLHIAAKGNILLSATGLYPQEQGIIMGDPVGFDTDFWLGRNADGDQVDDDLFQIGKGTAIAANPFMTIDRDGNVGIGTETPGEKLHIAARGNIQLSATGLYPQEQGIIMGDPVGFDTDFWLGRNADGDQVDDDLFQIGKGTAIAANPFMTIDRDGNVGIGTETPDEKLEVEWVSGGTDVEIGRGTSDTDITFIALRSPDGTKWYIYPDDSGNLVVTSSHP